MIFLKMSLTLLGHELLLYSNRHWEWTVNEQSESRAAMHLSVYNWVEISD